MTTYTIATFHGKLIATVPDGQELEPAIKREEEASGVEFDRQDVYTYSGMTLTDEALDGDAVFWSGHKAGSATDETGRTYHYAVRRALADNERERLKPKPIETAPTDDEHRILLLFCPKQGGWHSGCFHRGRWRAKIDIEIELFPALWLEAPPDPPGVDETSDREGSIPLTFSSGV